MSTENRVLLAQILGLVAIVAARFGIEISPEAQSDILAGLSAFGLLLTAVIAKAKSGTQPPENKQAGFAQGWMLSAVAAVAAAVLALHLTACVTHPNNALMAASRAIQAAAEEVGRAQQLGEITPEREGELLDRLQSANDELRRVERLINQCAPEDCQAPAGTLERISAVLSEVRAELAAQEARQ